MSSISWTSTLVRRNELAFGDLNIRIDQPPWCMDNHRDRCDNLKAEYEGISKDQVVRNRAELLETKNDLATLYKEQARHEKAELLPLKALEGHRLKLGDKHPHTQESMTHLIELYEAWGKPEQAEEWRVKLPQTGASE